MSVESIKATIDANIKPNGKQEISGSILNGTLQVMADALAPLFDLKERVEENEQLIEDLQNTKIDKEADDYYPQLSVGTADNLAGVDEVASEFSFRRSGGGAITDGVARVQSIKGNSVVWNQLLKNADFSSKDSWTYQGSGGFSVANNIATLTLQSSSYGLVQKIPTIAGHKYMFMCECVVSATPSHDLRILFYDTSAKVHLFSASTAWKGVACILTADVTMSDAQIQFLRPLGNLTQSVDAQIRKVGCIDLTQMFGSGNEPTTIDEFYKRIPMGVDLYEYNEGEVISMAASGIKSVGRNQWNEQWEVGYINANGQNVASSTVIRSTNYIKVLPNASYYVTNNNIVIYQYDSDKNFLSLSVANKQFTTSQNCRYIRFATASTYGIIYNHDICINLSDTDFNGQYEPYIEDSEDLSIVRKYFPNGMRSAGSAHDEIRYNKATNKWERVVRIGEVDLGTIGYSRGKYGDIYAFSCQIPQANKMVGLANMTCGIYVARVVGAAALNNMEMRGDDRVAYPNSLYIRNDAYTDTASFKAAMSGVMLYYELAEPIVTEIAEKDFNLDYKVENGGTEQAIAEGKSSALSADITYGFNAVGLIKQLRSLVEAMQAKLASL